MGFMEPDVKVDDALKTAKRLVNTLLEASPDLSEEVGTLLKAFVDVRDRTEVERLDQLGAIERALTFHRGHSHIDVVASFLAYAGQPMFRLRAMFDERKKPNLSAWD